jgi:hypothetical protein
MQKGKTETNHPSQLACLGLGSPSGRCYPGNPARRRVSPHNRCAERVFCNNVFCNNFLGRSLRAPEGVWARRESTVSHDQQQTPATFDLPLRPPPSRASPPNVPHRPPGRATEMMQTCTCDVPGPHRTRFSPPCAGSVA